MTPSPSRPQSTLVKNAGGCVVAILVVFGLLVLVSFCQPRPNAGSTPDYTKPLFLPAGSPVCTTEDGLAELLKHTRAGLPFLDGYFGCTRILMPPDMPGDKWTVTWIESDGIFDRWDRVTLFDLDGKPHDVWTVSGALRN